MNPKQYKRLYLGIIIISLGVILWCTYYWLGGFEEVKVYRLEPVRRTIVGQYFRGKSGDQTLRKLLDRCRTMIREKEILGELTVINYLSDTVPQNEISCFAGITLEGQMAEIPTDFEILRVDTNTRLAVFLSMHWLVRPSLEKVESMIREEAAVRNIELQDLYYQLIYQDNSISVEGWAR